MLVQTIAYPPARKGDVVDDYHGTKVADPYRWLEDVDSPDTRAWVEAENRVTFAYLEQIPERERIRNQFSSSFQNWGLRNEKSAQVGSKRRKTATAGP